MENYYIVKEEIIINSTFNEGIILRTTDKQRAERIANKTFLAMSKKPEFTGAIINDTVNKKVLHNTISGDSYIVEIEEYNSEDTE